MGNDEDHASTIDDLLHSYRLDEADLDDGTRDRIDDLVQSELRSRRLDVDDVLGSDALETVGAPIDDDEESVKRDRRVILGLAAAAALLAIVALVGGVLVSTTGSSPMVAGPEPITRHDLIVAANGAPEHRLINGERFYRRVLVARREPVSGYTSPMVVRTTESWVGVNGSGKQESSAESVLGTEPPATLWLAPKLGVSAGPGELNFWGFSYAQLRDLPSDREQLLKAVRARVRSSSSSSSATASLLVDVMSLDITPPSVRAAAVDALFEIGGRSIADVRGPDGRVGAGIAGEIEDGDEWVVILDSDDARALAFVTGPPGAVPTDDLRNAKSWVVYSSSGVTTAGD